MCFRRVSVFRDALKKVCHLASSMALLTMSTNSLASVSMHALDGVPKNAVEICCLAIASIWMLSRMPPNCCRMGLRTRCIECVCVQRLMRVSKKRSERLFVCHILTVYICCQWQGSAQKSSVAHSNLSSVIWHSNCSWLPGLSCARGPIG